MVIPRFYIKRNTKGYSLKKDVLHDKKMFLYWSIPVAFLLLIHCAYLNTYYNAQVAFNKAYKAHLKLINSHRDTSDILPDAIKNGYERTIIKCTKVLENYPIQKEWHDNALFLQAKATFYNKQYALSIRRFQYFIKEYPNHELRGDAYLFLGKSYLANADLQRAEETFSYILQNYPALNNNEEVTVLQAQIAIKREGKSQAIRILEKSLEQVKNDKKRLEIVIQLASLYIELHLFDKAIPLLLSCPSNKKFVQSNYQKDFLLLTCYQNIKKYDEALVLVNTLLKNKEYVANSAYLMYEKAHILAQTGQSKEAEKLYDHITKTPQFPAEIVAKAWFELGLIFQHDYGDFKQARICYEKTISIALDEALREKASQKRAGIDLATAIRDTIIINKNNASYSNSTVGFMYYKLGEVYWLNLSEPDSAFLQFSRISRDSTADSSLILKSLYAQAWIQKYIKKDTKTSDSIYKDIIRRYPTTHVAQKSQQDLGIPVTILTREDSAYISYLDAERLYFKDQDLVGAVNGYYKTAKRYWEIRDVSSKSIFSAAWICDNVLKKNQKAYELYKLLCDSFPESNLCTVYAQPRIKVVEDTLIVLKNLQKKKTGNNKSHAKDPPQKKDSPESTFLADSTVN